MRKEENDAIGDDRRGDETKEGRGGRS